MEAGQLSIRCISPEEIEVFKLIRLEALRCEPASFASKSEDWETLADEDWRQRLSDPVFVAFNNAEPVGLMGMLRFRPAKMAHRATLVMVYVRESSRGTGVAKKLLRSVFDHARQQGVTQIELSVSAANSVAIRFYRNQGFSEIARIPNGFLENTITVEEMIMMRRLDC
ncbi:GNAT family N-acetyltransferase (plasmid) [Agrobacterium sp. rho-13.3]|uniref:GNAT family N-acetyltransferase n=1 Tax=Agrobacterium sp. rho-13.3 TaxID=3072980 RepID=UPI002A1258E9|nr:GNAT family N-acetyltransferase [Agrobacterium sp. rho-13.3]MDX8310131.1 GNAT family N-acetyltransferase [Agrobacterium sp. rho-13.3]